MLEEIVRFFDRPETKVVIDATIGGAGHASALLSKIEGITLLLGLDKDEEAVERSRKRLLPYLGRAKVMHANFFDMEEALEEMGVDRADAILADLGVSSFQLDDAGRGFSFAKNGPLDMRMDRGRNKSAASVVNSYDQKDLVNLFRKYGEEKYAARIAKAIVEARLRAPIKDTASLSQIIVDAYPKKAAATSHIHPATRVFQAIRIEVNEELDRLGDAITQAIERLNPGGRIAIISFHSIEDRIVKQTFNHLTPHCICPKKMPVCVCGKPGSLEVLTKKPITPSSAETEENPRARSAKLRVAQKLAV